MNNDLLDSVKDRLDKLDLSQIEEYISSNFDNKQSLKTLMLSILNGEYSGNISDFLKIILESLSTNLSYIIPGLFSIVIVCIIFSILNGVQSDFLNKEIKNISYIVSYSAILITILFWIYQISQDTINIVLSISKFMELTFPILITLITILGGVVSTSIYSPIISFLSLSITSIISNIVLPLYMASIIILIISNYSNTIKLDKLSSLLKSSGNVILGGIFSLFITFISFQGLTSGIIDTVSIKSAKFAMQTYIPILGSYLSDGYDLIIASIVLIKNSFGVVIILILISIIIGPVIKILIISFALKLTAAIVEPIADKKIPKVLEDLSKIILSLIAVIVGVFIMFLITIMMLIYSFNAGAL